jgi:hypothetical protein
MMKSPEFDRRYDNFGAVQVATIVACIGALEAMNTNQLMGACTIVCRQ